MSKDAFWAWPFNAKKAHYFEGSRSLCRRWLFFGGPTPTQKTGEKPGPDDCVSCFKKLKATEKKND